MEYDPHLVQDFDEDLGFVQQDREVAPRVVPTFYGDVYTRNERLEFQNRQAHHNFDFNSDQPIHITRKATQIAPSTTVRKTKSKGPGKKKTGSLFGMKKKKNQTRPGLKRKTYKAYMGEHKKEGQENKDWNFDTKGTGGYFDKSLRRQMISHPLREKEDIVEDIKIKSPGKSRDQRERSTKNQRGRSAKSHREVYEEGRKNYYTDLDEFTQHVLDKAEERPKTSHLPRSEKREVRAYSSPRMVIHPFFPYLTLSKKKEVDLEKEVQRLMENQEDKEGKPNPFFARQAREILQKKRDKQFIVSMSVPRKEIYKPMQKVKKNRERLENTQPKYLEVFSTQEREKYQSPPRTERPTRSGLRPIDKSERIVEQERIYLQNQAEHTDRHKKAFDMYPSKENGEVNMNDIRSFSAKKRNASTSQGRRVDFAQDVQRKYIDEDLKRYHRQEIERRVEIDHAMSEYKNKLEERTADPNQYFNKISKGLENLRKDFNAVQQDLQHTNAYVNKNKQWKGSSVILARGAGKIIKLYSDKLTELLLDDMIYEMIPILQKKERNEHRLKMQRRKNELLSDCMEALKDLTFEQKRIEERAEEVYTLTAVTRNRIKTLEKGSSVGYSSKKLERRVGLEPAFIKKVAENVTSYKQFRKNTDVYSEKSNIMMDLLVRTMLDDLTKEVVGQFVEAQNEFVEQLLISEFD